MKRIQDIDVQGKKVIIRADMNVPIKDGAVQSNARILASLPTIEYVLQQNGRVIILSHLGRPQAGHRDDRYSLAPVAKELSHLLQRDIPLTTEYMKGILPEGDCILCENIRFVEGEVENDSAVAQKLAELGDIFVLDAFGTAHRAHASTVGITKYLPSYAGLLLEQEVDALSKAIEHIEKPSLAIVGGSKVSSKLGVLEFLSSKMDSIIVGGGIANTFLYAMGFRIGTSLYEPELVEKAKEIMLKTNIIVPQDVAVVTSIEADSVVSYKNIDSVCDNEIIVDIGKVTAEYYENIIAQSSTIIWNGPVGIFEIPSMSFGTKAICKAIAKNKGYSLAGGGDTIAAIEQFNIAQDISYISTGGGAFLEYIEGKSLPAIVALE